METQVSGVSPSSLDIQAAPSHPGGSGSIPAKHAVISREAKKMVRQRRPFMESTLDFGFLFLAKIPNLLNSFKIVNEGSRFVVLG
jgi:hypothetical protein